MQTPVNVYETDEYPLTEQNDDDQMLFVHIVLYHVKQQVLAVLDTSKTPPAPLRLLLLGTAGTGNTQAINTLLQ